jgi:ribulose kinase
MNEKGHAITSIYMSGGQAKNIPMMQLFADTCGMPVVLPFDHAGAVVLGAAMLGRFAAEAVETKHNLSDKEQNELIWKIMVCLFFVKV